MTRIGGWSSWYVTFVAVRSLFSTLDQEGIAFRLPAFDPNVQSFCDRKYRRISTQVSTLRRGIYPGAESRRPKNRTSANVSKTCVYRRSSSQAMMESWSQLWNGGCISCNEMLRRRAVEAVLVSQTSVSAHDIEFLSLLASNADV